MSAPKLEWREAQALRSGDKLASIAAREKPSPAGLRAVAKAAKPGRHATVVVSIAGARPGTTLVVFRIGRTEITRAWFDDDVLPVHIVDNPLTTSPDARDTETTPKLEA